MIDNKLAQDWSFGKIYKQKGNISITNRNRRRCHPAQCQMHGNVVTRPNEATNAVNKQHKLTKD